MSSLVNKLSGKWQKRVSCAILPIAIVVCLHFLGRQGRRQILGSVDAATGNRCRFTVSNAWRQDDSVQNGLQDNVSLSPSPFIPFPKVIADVWYSEELRPFIAIQSYSAPFLPADVQMIDGYPEPIFVDPLIVILKKRHLQIDGQPATVITYQGISGIDQEYRETNLYVYLSHQSRLYAVEGAAATPDFGEVNREMQAIIASFHVAKAVAPGDGVKAREQIKP